MLEKTTNKSQQREEEGFYWRLKMFDPAVPGFIFWAIILFAGVTGAVDQMSLQRKPDARHVRVVNAGLVQHGLLAGGPTERHLHAILDHAEPLWVIGQGPLELLSVCSLHEI